MKYLFLILALCSQALADSNTIVKLGIDPLAGHNSVTDLKTLSVSRDMSINRTVWWKVEGGKYWVRSNIGESAFYGNASIGLVLRPVLLDVRFFSGIGFITKTDQALGGHFQFFQQASVGIQDSGASLGLNVTHISNAGIVRPNRGRNFVTLHIAFPF